MGMQNEEKSIMIIDKSKVGCRVDRYEIFYVVVLLEKAFQPDAWQKCSVECETFMENEVVGISEIKAEVV